jgi:hypothetical protein
MVPSHFSQDPEVEYAVTITEPPGSYRSRPVSLDILPSLSGLSPPPAMSPQSSASTSSDGPSSPFEGDVNSHGHPALEPQIFEQPEQMFFTNDEYYAYLQTAVHRLSVVPIPEDLSSTGCSTEHEREGP